MFRTNLFHILGLILVLTLAAPVAHAGKRVALVIGNSDYISTSRLPNPERDAQAMAHKLGTLGFEVVEGYNLGYEDIRDTVRDFARQTRDAELAVVFYAGHGLAVDRRNYIVPIDARLDDPVDWEFEVYPLEDVLQYVSRVDGASLVFLDACRNNPMAEQLAQVRGMATRSTSAQGMSLIDPGAISTTGSVIAYATEPGEVALDGNGDNSPFTTALLRHIGTANQDFAALTSLITRDVLDMTEGTQRPRFDVSLTGPLVLNRVDSVVVGGATPSSTSAAPSAAGLEVEKVIFDTARASNDIADYQAYLDSFPNGVFAVLARNAISRLQAESGARVTGAVAQNSGTAGGGGVQLAAATLNYRSTDPLVLTVTPEARGMVGSQISEEQLGLSRQQRKELQLRLNLSGNSVGRPDGIVGPGTRRGISSWQGQVGFPVTGYLNAVQHQMLVANTEIAFSQHMAANPAALSTPKSSGTRTSKKKSSGNNAAIGAFIGGVATGILLSK